MLEKVSNWKNRKFAPGSRPDNKTVIAWIKEGKYYGEKIGGLWWIDDSVTVLPQSPAPVIDTGNDVADMILRSINGR